MKIESLYEVTKEDIPRLIETLTECFLEDPLYQKLIPDIDLREKLLPGIFECEMEEMLASCDLYADSPEINGLVIVDDETEPYSKWKYYTTEALFMLKAEACLVKEDLSLKTFWNFFMGRQYLNSKWAEALPENRMHLIYFAVRSACRGKGVAHKMITPVLKYADKHQLLVSLETHNPVNLPMYKHYHFDLYDTLQSHFDLVQYCLVRPAGAASEDQPCPED